MPETTCQDQEEERKKDCSQCYNKVNIKASICDHCGSPQGRFGWLKIYKQNPMALLLVFVAISQVIVGFWQTKETYTKRVEAEKVLDKANRVLASTSSMSNRIQKSAQKAIDSSNKLTEIANINIENVESKIVAIEGRFKTKTDEIISDISAIKNDLTKELSGLKYRNKLTLLGDNAISSGNRISLDKLYRIHQSRFNQNLDTSMVLSEIFRVKSFYISVTRIKSIIIHFTDEDGKLFKNKDIPTAVLINSIQGSSSWKRRAKAASLLGTRKEKDVPDVLIDAINNDESLDVVKQAVDSFSKLTGYENDDVFGNPSMEEWWTEKKALILEKFK